MVGEAVSGMQQESLFAAPAPADTGAPHGHIGIASWNVNSANSRARHIIDYMHGADAPDVLLLQEIKCVDDAFPAAIAEETGLNCVTHGQKTYNGVAILSRFPISGVKRGLPGMEDDPQARFIEAYIEPGAGIPPVKVMSVYVPNGSSPESDKFAYKKRFFTALCEYLREEAARPGEYIVCGGDYNAVFDAEYDVYDPAGLEGTVCCHPQERAFMRLLQSYGYCDAFRAANGEVKAYSWWDYRGGKREKNEGYRIDHLLANAELADMLTGCYIDCATRDLQTPSDHAPVRGVFVIQ